PGWILKRLVPMPQRPVDVRKGIETGGVMEMSLQTALFDDGRDEVAFVADRQVWEDRGEGVQPRSPPFDKQVPCHAGHGRRIECPAQRRSSGEGAPQPAADRLRQEIAEGRRVFAVRTQTDLPRRIEGPVGGRLRGQRRRMLATHGDAVTVWQAED